VRSIIKEKFSLVVDSGLFCLRAIYLLSLLSSYKCEVEDRKEKE
jgi:hypothetical protein